MAEKTGLDLQEILDNPIVKMAVDDVNRTLTDRRAFMPPICKVFSSKYTTLEETDAYRFSIDREAERQLPKIIRNRVQVVRGNNKAAREAAQRYTAPRRIGIVFSGGPAPGGHNVIAGLYDAAMRANPENRLFGFLVGPEGVVENEAVEITRELVDAYRNLGGFTMIKTGRAKIDSRQKVEMSRHTCRALGLNALVIVGGDDSNTNAAFLAEELYDDGIQVIGVPKTIDGDIQVRDDAGHVLCAVSFGFHTAARAFANSIAGLCNDASSDIKYYHVCKVMGRVASHLALEVALQSHPNFTVIGEDLVDFVDEERLEKARRDKTTDYTAYGMTLRHLSRIICEGIVKRARAGKNYGVIVIPEGVLEFINEVEVFIMKLNTIIAEYNRTHDREFHSAFPLLEDKLEYLHRLAQRSRDDTSYKLWNTRDEDLFNDLPEFFQEGLLTERDSHGNFQFSQIQTEKVLMGLVHDYLNILKEKGTYKLGIPRGYFRKTLAKEGLDPDRFGPAIFDNYGKGEHLLAKASIISAKTLRQELEKAGLLEPPDKVPAAVEAIYKKTVPSFKTQEHFYGYDGRGNDPTRFDCSYTYNLGMTVFSLVANGATGQMAAIRNLEHDFERWEPIGIPIAPLMHLEERKGRLALVLEKALVDVDSVAMQVFKTHQEKWLAADSEPDHYRRPGPIHVHGESEGERPITLQLNAIVRPDL
ncbi:MAG: 6-phosphofructokinase [Desulfobacterales bacterium]|jgi:pyrophosphate--fructose-6-phosphate 1-phosphotransferase|nr:6-phosphofructokinase [Desulfobacterales bacterium]